MIPVAKRYNLSGGLQKVYDVVLDLWQEGSDYVYSATDIVNRCRVQHGFTERQTLRRLDSLTVREVLRMVPRNTYMDDHGDEIFEPFYGPHSFEQGEP